MEFHISRQARDYYNFDQSIFTFNGNVIFANFHAARIFTQKINQKRDLIHFPERAVKAGQINALGLIDEILHFILALYRQQKNPAVMQQALEWLQKRIGKPELDRTLLNFISEFPPLAVYRQEETAAEYLDGTTEGVPNHALVLEELLMLWVTNKNPATTPYSEIFDDAVLQNETPYYAIIRELAAFFEDQPPFGPDQQNLIEMLRSPAVAVPNSLFGQLEFIRQRWGDLIGHYLYRLLSSLDLIKEEEKMPFLGAGIIPVPTYAIGADAEHERFSRDRDWMPSLVLIAKNSHVWLDQLSKKYERSITRLDQIPDSELDQLAAWGFSGLWLIGVWQRSPASARIKQLCGNPEAIASAYSLSSYQIAEDLGSEYAFQSLQARAWQRGIRLASDMVPNHMGIDSSWVIEHPDWFISLPYSPFPSYTFSGPDLSSDPRASIFLEDHYYDRSDAAVVFKHIDHTTGEQRYIYHGNDGTSMPWNDTAQLNYLNPQVREAVLQTILDVVKKFPIIRFDAAMTLTKRHYQRLWFPEPGSGGDIPSRAEQGLDKAQFDALMPNEFWREVVDRAAVEAPDTLLLAEAFWLMEGYFVRTLGMHRVYNSAFMNMLRDEDNARYRLVIKNTLEFDPEILKRFVNFMNNPDERTAIDQFGKGDKYFGICTMMATLPGLPMFGHGQIEGYTEKYGMEYRRAYWDETPDPYLIERHQREVFPLLHRRPLFAGVENFRLYDFFTPEGIVNEDVFAYSNSDGYQHALVVYNNRYAEARGWIHNSAAFVVKQGASGSKNLVQETLAAGLSLSRQENLYMVFRDHITGLEYIRSSRELAEKGMYLELGAYRTQVFIDFRQISDDGNHSYRRLCDYLNGRGVPSIEIALKELLLQPVQNPFRQIVNPGYFSFLLAARQLDPSVEIPQHLMAEAHQKMESLIEGLQALTGSRQGEDMIQQELAAKLTNVLRLPALKESRQLPAFQLYQEALEYTINGLEEYGECWLVLLSWLFTHNLGKLVDSENYTELSLSWLDEYQFGKILSETFQAMGQDEQKAWQMVGQTRLLIAQQNWYERARQKPLIQILEYWLADGDIQNGLGINRYQETLWFNQEAFEQFLWWMMAINLIQSLSNPGHSTTQIVEEVLAGFEINQKLKQAIAVSGYKVEELLSAARSLS